MAKLVVLSATWCGPCRSLKSKLRDAGISFRTIDVDTDSGERLARKIGVASIPAVFVDNGERLVRVTGGTVGEIRAALRRHA